MDAINAAEALSSDLIQFVASKDSRITSAVIEVGALSGVEHQSLEIMINNFIKGTRAEGVKLTIVESPAEVECRHGHVGAPKIYGSAPKILAECGKCGSGGVLIRRGRGVRLGRLEFVSKTSKW